MGLTSHRATAGPSGARWAGLAGHSSGGGEGLETKAGRCAQRRCRCGAGAGQEGGDPPRISQSNTKLLSTEASPSSPFRGKGAGFKGKIVVAKGRFLATRHLFSTWKDRSSRSDAL